MRENLPPSAPEGTNSRRRIRLRYTTPWQAILRAAGEFYKDRAGGSGFVTLRRDKAYLRTRSVFVHYAVTSRTVRRYTTPWQAILRAAGEFYKRECTFVLDPASFHYAVTSRTVRRSKARDFPQDCLPQVWYSALIFTYS